MDAFRNLFPHPQTFFPSRSRQTRNISRTSHRTPAWYSDRESPRYPRNLARDPVVDTSIRPALHTCNSPPPCRPRQRQQQKRRNGYECSPELSAYEAEKTRNRRINEEEFFTRRRTEELLRRHNDANEIFRSQVNEQTGIENREREREVELEIQRRIEGVIDMQAQMQESVFQERERIDHEWRCVERAWEVLETARDRDRRKEREFVDWVESSLDGEEGGVGVDYGGRRYRGWNEGRW
ncbi:hypothetical protein OCU04_010776 [Sclerotinia nivalis]|uniref:Uncharacterized protein n=1 Tax=Sclerotinia nivalis TaxID=352851 RepID=A0A9X0DED3_9HELO|nr:hypothetical protein OCU04_010776 [Sclerotinia nivalis]